MHDQIGSAWDYKTQSHFSILTLVAGVVFFISLKALRTRFVCRSHQAVQLLTLELFLIFSCQSHFSDRCQPRRKLRVNLFTTGNPFLGTKLLGFSTGRGSGALKGLMSSIACDRDGNDLRYSTKNTTAYIRRLIRDPLPKISSTCNF